MKNETPSNVEKLKKRLKELLREKFLEPAIEKKYTVADVHQETKKILTEEMAGYKKSPLTDKETEQMDKFAKTLANSVLKEMKIL